MPGFIPREFSSSGSIGSFVINSKLKSANKESLGVLFFAAGASTPRPGDETRATQTSFSEKGVSTGPAANPQVQLRF
jgi:hypothetical protein